MPTIGEPPLTTAVDPLESGPSYAPWRSSAEFLDESSSLRDLGARPVGACRELDELTVIGAGSIKIACRNGGFDPTGVALEPVRRDAQRGFEHFERVRSRLRSRVILRSQ